MRKVLICEDDEEITNLLVYNFQKSNFEVEAVLDSNNFLEKFQAFRPDVVITDLMMPGVDGIELVTRLREDHNNEKLIIVMLTARSEDYTEIAAIKAGVDYYQTKPVRIRVLITKVEILLDAKFKKDTVDEIYIGGDLEIDAVKFEVKNNGEAIILPKKEFELLQFLASKPGKVFNRSEIMKAIWGEDVFVTERTIDVHINKLRNKLGQKKIRTYKGIGYSLFVK